MSDDPSHSSSRRGFLKTATVLATAGALGLAGRQPQGVDMRLVDANFDDDETGSQAILRLGGGKAEDIREIVIHPLRVSLHYNNGHKDEISLDRSAKGLNPPDDGTRIFLTLGKNNPRRDYKIRIDNPEEHNMRVSLHINSDGTKGGRIDVDTSKSGGITQVSLEDDMTMLTVSGLSPQQVARQRFVCHPELRPHNNAFFAPGGTMTQMEGTEIITPDPKTLEKCVRLRDSEQKTHIPLLHMQPRGIGPMAATQGLPPSRGHD